jgi:hypothetical protein
MPSSAPQIPAAAVEAAGEAAMAKHSFRPYDETTRTMLEAAYPHLLAAFEKPLLDQAQRFDDEAAEVNENPTIGAVKRIQAETIRTALASIDSDGGAACCCDTFEGKGIAMPDCDIHGHEVETVAEFEDPPLLPDTTKETPDAT